VEEIVRRAAADASIAAGHRLVEELGNGALRAVIARAGSGTFLVAAARKTARSLLVTAPVSVSTSGWRVERRATLEACAIEPIVVGVCEAER